MKIDFDKIIDKKLLSPPKGHPHRKAIKAMMYDACIHVLDEAIKSFPSHEHPEIAKSILKIKEEL